MKVFIFLALLAVATASYGTSHTQAPGPTEADQPAGPTPLDQPAGPAEDATNAANARRQHEVNYQALHYGAGVGTAPYYGVPGADLKGVHNDGYNSRPYGDHGGYHGGYNGHQGGYAQHGGYAHYGYGAHHAGYHGGYTGYTGVHH